MEQHTEEIKELKVMQRKLDKYNYDYFVVDRRNRQYNEINLFSLEEILKKYGSLIDKDSVIQQCQRNRNSTVKAIGVLVIYKHCVQLLVNTTNYLKNVVLENTINGKYWTK